MPKTQAEALRRRQGQKHRRARMRHRFGAIRGDRTLPLLLAVLAALPLTMATPSGGSGAEWTTSGPEGGEVGAIAVDPDDPSTVYVAMLGGGVFKSTDGGDSWMRSSTGLEEYGTHGSLALDPSPAAERTLYVGGSVAYKSTDSGDTWLRGGNGSSSNSALALVLSAPQTLYGGSSWGTMAKTIDGGTTWQPLGTLAARIDSIVVHPGDPDVAWIGVYPSGVKKTENGGTTWIPKTTGLADFGGGVLLLMDPSSSSVLYAGTRGGGGENPGGLFKSQNGADTWTDISGDFGQKSVTAIAISPSAPAVLYVANGATIYRSGNAGGTWTEISSLPTPPMATAVTSLTVAPDSSAVVYAGTNAYGVYKSIDSGGTWAPKNAGLVGTEVYDVDARFFPGYGLHLWAAVEALGRAKTFRSVNGGGSWSELDLGNSYISQWSVAIKPDDRNTVLLGNFKTTDGGLIWNFHTGCSSALYGDIAFDPTEPLHVVRGCTAGGGVLESFDAGDTWVPINGGLDTYYAKSVDAVAFVPGVGTMIGTEDGVFVRSGGLWISQSTGIPTNDNDISGLAYDAADSQVLYAANDGDGFYRSIDGGATWASKPTGLTDWFAKAVVAHPSNSGEVYLGTIYAGVFRSTDGGETWSPFNDGLPDLEVRSLAIDAVDGGTLVAATRGPSGAGGGVFRRILSAIHLDGFESGDTSAWSSSTTSP